MKAEHRVIFPTDEIVGDTPTTIEELEDQLKI